MMGIVVPETCWTYKKYNKIISGILLVLVLQLYMLIVFGVLAAVFAEYSSLVGHDSVLSGE